MFARRRPLTLRQRLRGMIWPRSGFRRMGLYFWHRVQRLPGSPHQIALGFSMGAGISTTPLLGFHVGIAALLTFLLRGNIVAAIIGTAVANPWTLPFFWASSYEIGMRLLGRPAGAPPSTGFSLHDLWERLQTLLLPMLVGSLPLVIVAGLLGYGIVYFAIRSVRRARAERIRQKRAARLATETAALEEQRADEAMLPMAER